jgi:DNA-binding transcriptional MocR family regulator
MPAKPILPPSAPPSAAQRLAARLRQEIEAGRWQPGARLDSLRTVAAQSGVSRYAVLAAYQELAGLGLVEARHGSGFYLARQAGAAPRYAPSLDQLLDTALLIRGLVEPSALLKCGSGSLPKDWLQDLDLARQVRWVAAQPGSNLHDYGTALGYPPLREALCRRLARRRIVAAPEQIVLSNGISHGLELVVRALCHPGDLVLVEHPAYYNLFGLLHLSGLRALGVPRTGAGPDLAALEALLRRGERPRLFILQSLLHNPTGTSLAPATAHRLLALADQYDFQIVEDDAYGDLAEEADLRLAALDGLKRVIYLSGFTKTLSASLRVGYAVAAAGVTEALTRVKLLTSIASSEFAERVVQHSFGAGYDRCTAMLRQRLQAAQAAAQAELQRAGWQLFPGARGGMFIWARHPRFADSVPLAKAAAAAGFWFAPGSAFDLEHRPSPWVRFNVAYRSPALSAWLASYSGS